ncbi:transketolase [Candidatus Gracilibacteria bacterium]|nr:transketolase [Candidatus Gracilibacteria bacterium]
MIFKSLPKLGEKLNEDHLEFLEAFSKSCRHSILQMVVNAQSGHPGGSLSCIDYLSVIYAFLIGQNGNKIVVSNGHISPGVYSTLAEMGYIPKKEVVANFRKIGSVYEGHITRHVDGVDFGTGPLGVGVSAATGFAIAEKMHKSDKKVFTLMGDGECQEGQVHEMIHFARHYNLDNLIAFVDYNKVQLTASLADTMDIDICKIFEAGHWHVIEVDAHDPQAIWKALAEAHKVTCKPVVLVGHSIMGQGVAMMEQAGRDHKPDWHGKAPKPEDAVDPIKLLEISAEQEALLDEFRKTHVTYKPTPANDPKNLTKLDVETGTPIVYDADEVTDCRTAYGKALLDLAMHNENIIALTADVKGSVMTKFVASDLPAQYVECGIAEQHMVSASGAFSLAGFIPFCSTFGAFLSSRAKDQARVNDINHCNVKMVATHCGLSVGEDGPTHQAIDDKSSFTGMFNTMIIEPSDPNHTDRVIRYVASHYGNFYVRMGRHKFPIITKEDGSVFYGEDYKYQYGKCDIIRKGSDITIAACGATIHEALEAAKELEGVSVEIIAVPSLKKFSEEILESVKKTKKLITVEDHNIHSGMGAMLASHIQQNGITLEAIKVIGVEEYQFSGKADQLYEKAGIDSKAIAKAVKNLL